MDILSASGGSAVLQTAKKELADSKFFEWLTPNLLEGFSADFAELCVFIVSFAAAVRADY